MRIPRFVVPPFACVSLLSLGFALGTAVPATAPLGGPGPGSWLATLDRVARDKVVLRQRDALFAARQEAIMTLPRAAQAGHMLADRGLEALRDLGRKIPERWLDANVVRGVANGAVSAYAWARLGDITSAQFRALASIQRELGEVGGKVPVGDGLTVDEHAVVVENHEVIAHGMTLNAESPRAEWHGGSL